MAQIANGALRPRVVLAIEPLEAFARDVLDRIKPEPLREAILNHLFSLVLGQSWDGMAGARGISRRAAQAILNGCSDEEISVDVSWPLYLQSLGGYTLGYLATEGMEFETQDRYPQEVADAGGLEAWINLIDSENFRSGCTGSLSVPVRSRQSPGRP